MVRWCWLCLAAVLVSVIVADTAAAARACWLGGPCLELHGGASDLTLTHTHTDIHDMQVKPAHIRLEGASHGEWRACVREEDTRGNDDGGIQTEGSATVECGQIYIQWLLFRDKTNTRLDNRGE